METTKAAALAHGAIEYGKRCDRRGRTPPMCFSIGRTQDVHEGSPEIVEAAHTDMIFRDMCVIFTIGSLVTMVWFSHEFFGDPKTEAYNNWVGMTGYGDHHDKFPLSTHITWPTDKM